MALLIGHEGLADAPDAEDYTLRDNVRALRCPDGVTVTDADGNTALVYTGACVLVQDGDELFPMDARIFDAVYRPHDADSDAPTTTTTTDQLAEPAPAPDVAPVGTDTPAAGTPAGDVTGGATSTGADVTPAPETGGAGTTTESQTPAPEASTTATPSVASLSDQQTPTAQDAGQTPDAAAQPAPGQ